VSGSQRKELPNATAFAGVEDADQVLRERLREDLFVEIGQGDTHDERGRQTGARAERGGRAVGVERLEEGGFLGGSEVET
jgi:hypothetical protein